MSDGGIQSRRAAFRRQMREANSRAVRNGRELQRAIDAWARAAREDALLAMLAEIWDCYARMIRRTPVDSGRARAGWHIERRKDEWKPAPGQYADAKEDAAGIITREAGKLGGLTRADVIYIMNNVEYILALEAGWSRQSSGFVALFLSELKAQLEEAARRWERER